MNWLLTPLPVWKEIIFIALPLALLAIAGNLGWYVDSKDLKKTRRAYWKHRDANILLEEKYATLKDESNKMAAKYIVATGELHKADETIKQQIDEITHLHAQNTKLREDLQEAQAENALWLRAVSMLSVEEIENLLLGQVTPMLRERIVRMQEHQMVPLEEVKPAPAKRPARKKATQN